MAVYKATYCYPFLNTVDIRVGRTTSATQPAEYLKCKVDTSNKDVTGYSVRLLDNDNNVIFPKRTNSFISPISELKDLPMYTNKGTNSGINGTYLEIPFFQNKNANCVRLNSYNAIYYGPKYLMDHIILNSSLHPAGSKIPEMENIDKWEFGDTGHTYLQYIGTPGDRNSITLDGEVLNANDKILISSNKSTDKEKTGLWKVSWISDESALKKTVLTKFNGITDTGSYQPSAGEYITIIRGKTFHNTVWERNENHIYSQNNSKVLWYAYNDNDALVEIPELSVDGLTLKWEITLYQGLGEKKSNSNTSPYYYSYDNLSNEWLDMKLFSGKILGSTPERVQIASDDIEGSDIYLPSGKDSTLVLQTRYMDLSNLYNTSTGKYNTPDIFSGTRVYVQGYDSTYGHVYPLNDALESSVVDSTTHVQFFKHSNNPEDILNTDIVDYGFEEAMSIGYYNSGTSSTTAKIYAKKAEWKLGKKITELGITTGQTILLISACDETEDRAVFDLKRNGVYSLEGEEDLPVGTSGATVRCYVFKRAASYTTWAAYIGKIIYCSQGSLGGKNIESLANAGTFTLWNPRSSTSGSSNLLFTNEMPILLFPQKLGKNCTFNFYDKNHPSTSDHSVEGVVIDQQNIQIGNLILYTDGKVLQVTNITSNGYTGTLYNVTIEDNYFYITDGEKFGHRVWKKSDMENPNWDLYTAKILKNSATYTYVSPFANLAKDMQLKLLNNKKIIFDGTETSWIKVLGYQSTISRITHAKISENSAGIEDKHNGTYGLISYSPENNSAYPWKYEVRSYFKSSDENVFYSYESPYLILKRNGEQFTDLSGSRSYYDFAVDMNKKILMVSDQDAEGGYQKFQVGYYYDASVVTGRSIELSAEYRQFQQSSWESYRWILLDKEGNTLQDTGKKYDKSLGTTFYGLANDGETNTIYYAVLYVEDELGNVLQYVIKFEVSNADASQLEVPFTATFDCDTHSVLLNYQDTGIVMPCFKINDNYLQVYDSSSSDPSTSLWDGGIQYVITEKGINQMHISNIGADNDPPIYYVYGSQIATEGDNWDGQLYTVSNSIHYGVVYSDYFSRFTTSDDISNNISLRLNDDENGQFYFDTQVNFDNNFCGEFLAINVESQPEEGLFDPYLDMDEKIQYLSGYLTFAFSLPDNLSNDATLNENRNKIALKIYADRNGGKYGTVETVIPRSGDGYFFGSTATDSFLSFNLPEKSYYYLQDEEEDYENAEFLHFQFGDKRFWMKKDKDGNFFSSKNKFFGNLNLIAEDDVDNLQKSGVYITDERSKDAPSYWAEERMYLCKKQNYKQYFINNDVWHFAVPNSNRIDNSVNKLKWPAQNEENKIFWNETNNSTFTDNDVVLWNNVNKNTPNISCLTSRNRHETLTDKDYRVTLWIKNVYELYTGVQQDTISISYNSGTWGKITTYNIELKKGTETLGTIRLAPINKEGGE